MISKLHHVQSVIQFIFFSIKSYISFHCIGTLSDFDSDIVKDVSLEEGDVCCAYLSAGTVYI